MLAHFVVPTLMAGSAAVIKPPSACPLSTLLFGRLLQALPSGVVSILTGGAETGQRLMTAPQVTTMAFAGSASSGRLIESMVTGAGKGFWGEVGSADAVVVCADSALDVVVPALIWSRLRHAGRSSLGAKRIYLERSIADAFLLQAHLHMAEIEFGDPLLSSTDVGPLGSLEAIRRVEDQVAYSMKAGARLVVGGMRFRPAGLPGFFFQPTILTNTSDSMRVMREEVLGPVLAIQVVDDLSDALTTAGFADLSRRIGICTQDGARVADLSRRVPTVPVWVNEPMTEVDVYGISDRGNSVQTADRPWRAVTFPYKNRLVPEGGV
jgi:acyl-CoA reductase-like NAD-dependent aldehyde dehydrogenase